MTSLYHIIKSDALEFTLPNIEIALRMYLSLMPTNCTGERSFLKLKIIKNQLRNCMQQMTTDCISTAEHWLYCIVFSDIVQACAAAKSRKKNV